MIKGIAYQAAPWGLIRRSEDQVRKDLEKIKEFGFNAIKIWGPSIHLIEDETEKDLFFDETTSSKVWGNFKEKFKIITDYFSRDDIYALFAPTSFPFEDTSVEEFVKWFLRYYKIVKGCEVSIYNELTMFSNKFKGKYNKVGNWLSFLNKALKKAQDKTGDEINYTMGPREFKSLMDKKSGFLSKMLTRRSTEIKIKKFMELIPYWFVNWQYSSDTKEEHRELIRRAKEISGKDFIIAETSFPTYREERAFDISAKWWERGEEYNEEGQKRCWEKTLNYFHNELADEIMGYFIFCFKHPQEDMYGIFKRRNGELIPKESAKLIKKKLNNS